MEKEVVVGGEMWWGWGKWVWEVGGKGKIKIFLIDIFFMLQVGMLPSRKWLWVKQKRHPKKPFGKMKDEPKQC